jgi:hypothetical protein
MLDLGGRIVTGDQSKGKEGKLCGYYILDTVTLRNGLVPDPERLPEVMNKHFTEQMTDFLACPWLEGQGGDLDGEHNDSLTHALTALVGNKNDEAFGVNTMDTHSGNKPSGSLWARSRLWRTPPPGWRTRGTVRLPCHRLWAQTWSQ